MCIHKIRSMVTLPQMELAVLKALADACDYSLGAHVPIEAISRKFPKNLRGDVKKNLRKLRAKGYCVEHPTRRNVTWQLTYSGLTICKTVT